MKVDKPIFVPFELDLYRTAATTYDASVTHPATPPTPLRHALLVTHSPACDAYEVEEAMTRYLDHRATVLEALRTCERAALTSREIAKATGLELDTVKDALTGLRRSGLVKSEHLRPSKAPGAEQFEPTTYYVPVLRWQDAMP